MYDEDKREVMECFTKDTVGKKYSRKIVSAPKTAYKAPYKAEIFSMNLNSPIEWQRFSKLSQASQKEYLLHLREEYGAQQGEIADMLGVSPAWLCKHSKNTLGISSRTGKRKRTPAQEAKWQKFLAGEMVVEPKVEEPVVEETKPEPQPEPKPDGIDPFALSTVMRSGTMCNKAHLEFEGDVNMVYLAAVIGSLKGDATNCKITVTIERM